MHLITLFSGLCALSTSFIALAAVPGTSDKRGLIYIPRTSRPNWSKSMDDDWKIFLDEPSDVSWYYNYQAQPESEITAYSPNTIFVPMLWGMPKSASDTTFLDTVTRAVKNGQRIDSVLFINEPDGGHSTGGSSVSAYQAAQLWKSNMEPLKLLTGYDNIINGTIKLGGPAVTGAPTGQQWLMNFQEACEALGGCDMDFLPIHWYGNFEGLAGSIGEKKAAFPEWTNEMWVTEYALNNEDLHDTQDFFNTSAEYFNRLDYVGRYSYFGSFRSSVSNVGPNVAMLDGQGDLTDIGAFYLGRPATGVVPTSEGAGARSTPVQQGLTFLSAAAVLLWITL